MGESQAFVFLSYAHADDEFVMRLRTDLEAQDIREALRFAAESVRERELPLLASS